MVVRLLGLALLLALIGPAAAEPVEILSGQAGLYPVKARLSAPAVVGPAALEIEVAPPTEKSRAVKARLGVTMFMDMPGMPRMKPINAKIDTASSSIESGGRYSARLEFPMKGLWRLHFIFITPHGEYHMISRLMVGPGQLPAGLPATGGEICGPGEAPGGLTVTSPDGPLTVGPNRLRISVPAGAGAVTVGVDMPAMAMAIPVQEARRQSDGSFEADVRLPMYGVWHLRADVDGRVLGPVSLIVAEPARRSPSQGLLVLGGVLFLPLGGWWWLRRKPWGPLALGGALMVSTLAAGAVIERYWPPDNSQGMAMDMLAPDMGMAEMVAPVPVLDAVVTRLPFSVRQRYPARVRPLRETLVTSSQGGAITTLSEPGTPVKVGQEVGRVGSQVLRSSLAGVVVRRLVEPGVTVTAGTPVLAVADIRRVAIDIRFPVADHDRIVPGGVVDVLASQGEVASTITSVSAVSEGATMTARAVVNNLMAASAGMGPPPKPGELRPLFALGQDVTARCLLTQVPMALCVPRDALRESAGKPAVFVIQDVAGRKVARLRQVTTGPANDSHVMIASGLQEGEVVAVAADESLRDGAVVTLATWGSGAYRSMLIPRDDSGH